jgi:glycosyltransferase involved in cell wall biosynthesis
VAGPPGYDETGSVKMRIAFDYQTFCQQSYGGISRYFVRLAEQFITMQQDVGIFAPLHRNHYVKVLPAGVVHGHALSLYPPMSVLVMLALNHVFSNRAIQKWRPQVVHETYYSRWGSAPRSCPTVVTVYDMIHELFRDHFPARDKSTILKRMAIDRADHVICISVCTHRDVVDLFGIREEKLSVVHLGFERFASDIMSTKKYLSPTKPYLLYVGSREKYKNFSAFVRAVASSGRLKADFDILAFGSGRFSASEMALLSELGFQPDQARQLGGDDTLLGHLYDHAAAFVYPSLYEGFGMPLLEAMAHQCAVISSNTSSMPEVIGEAGEFFDPKSIDDMALAIERVVYSPSRTQDLIERGRKRLDLFSWERCADRTLDIYRSLVGQV